MHKPSVRVTILETTGSVPQDAGAQMIVTAEGRQSGTVGGGKIEKRSIDLAHELLDVGKGASCTRFVDWHLKRDLGKICGGAAKLFFEVVNPACDCLRWAEQLHRDHVPHVQAVVVTADAGAGLVPGTRLLMTAEGLQTGTLGADHLNERATTVAVEMLASDGSLKRSSLVEWHVDGKKVRLYFEGAHHRPWRIVIFGAGHVAQALIRLLLTIDCHVTCIDTREEWLGHLPTSPRLTRTCAASLQGEVAKLPSDAFVLLMTPGYGTDIPILLEIARTRTFPFLGSIGSKTKAAQMRADIARAGLSEEVQRSLCCPLGLDMGSNDPAEIAVSMTAQLIQERDRRSHRME